MEIKGLITRIESKDYYVLSLEEDDKAVRCSLRGKFKKDFNLKKDKLYAMDMAVVGDFVEFQMNQDGSGVIYKIDKRKNYLSRKAPKIKGASYRGERLEQIIASNIDNFFIVVSVDNPPFNNKALDRFLVAGESSHLTTKIVINKSDLDPNNLMNEWISLYKNIGYSVFLTSTKNGEGIDSLRENLKEKKNLFWGHSGVGKSSLLNKLYPGLDLQIGKISAMTDRGTHTTVTSVMIKTDDNTFVIDTPGIREIDPYGIRKEDVSHFFPEFSDYNDDCRFNTCTHHHEPGCAVIEAVENEKISPERYGSYLRIIDTIEEDIVF